jgi:AcrR family transcriptional regulator
VSDATTQAILDGTRACILDLGVRRTTLSEVARRADVSRMTVYRHYPDVDAILRDLMTREFVAVMQGIESEADAHPPGGTSRERLVSVAVAGVRALREHPLLVRVLAAEPDLFTPYLFDQIGGSQRHARELMRLGVLAGQQDGSIRAGDPLLLAQSLLLTAQSFLYSATSANDVPADDLDGELRRLLDAYLRP